MFGSAASQGILTWRRTPAGVISASGCSAVGGEATAIPGAWDGAVLTYSTAGALQVLAKPCPSSARTCHQCVVLSAKAAGTMNAVPSEGPSATACVSAASLNTWN